MVRILWSSFVMHHNSIAFGKSTSQRSAADEVFMVCEVCRSLAAVVVEGGGGEPVHGCDVVSFAG